MEEEDGVQKLFYELSSDSRLAMLRELQSNSLKMLPLARKLNMTDTETFRQVQRLVDSLLIEKNTDGTYAITQYGRLVLRLSVSFSFAYKNRELLLTRDLWRLPDEFVERIGALSEARVSNNMFVIINGAENILESAEEYVWVIGEEPIKSLAEKVYGLVPKGVKIRLMYPESLVALYPMIHGEKGVVERRTIASPPLTILITDKEASMTLNSLDKRSDYAAFRGNDPSFRKWVEDLFLHYWRQGITLT